jgi:CRISPR-associated protein Cst2
LYSLALAQVGAFSYRQRTGFRNLDDARVKIAQERGLEHVESEKLYRLPRDQRLTRIVALFEGMAHLQGGAKQTLHYTDVAPAVSIAAITKGGNHIFGHVIGANGKGLPELKIDALKEALRVFADDLRSPVFVGWTSGYLDDERAKLAALAAEDAKIQISHPRESHAAIAAHLTAHPELLD